MAAALDALELRVARLELEMTEIREQLSAVLPSRPSPAPVVFKPSEASSPPPLPEPVPPPQPAPLPQAAPIIPATRRVDLGRLRGLGRAESSSVRSIERVIGERWAMIVGAIVVVIGVGLFFKWAYDVGWLHAIAPWLRCALGGLFGAALLIVGELARTRINARAGAGFSAAGIGVMYTSAYAAHQLFELISPAAAFVLLAMCVVLGIGVSVRAHLASVGMVSLVAGYLTPLLLSSAASPVWFLPAYLIALLMVALALSSWKGGRFSALRTAAWWGTVLLGAMWFLVADVAPIAWTVFAGLVWSLVHAESLLSTRNARSTLRTVDDWNVSWRRARYLVTSFATSAWAVGLGLLVYSSFDAEVWIVPLIACAGSIGSIVLSSGSPLALLRRPVTSQADELRVALAVQAGAFAVGTIALFGAPWIEIVVWSMLGLGAIVAGRRLRAGSLAIYGLLVLLALIARQVAIGSLQSYDTVMIAGLALSRWSLQMAIAGAGLIVGAWSTRSLNPTDERAGHWNLVACWGIAIGLTTCVGGLMTTGSAAASILAAGLVLSVMISIVGVFMRCMSVRVYGLVVFGLALLALPTTEWWIAQGTSAFGLVFTTDMLLLVFASGVAAALSWLAARALPADRRLQRTLMGVGTALLLISVTHADALAGVITLAWIAMSVGMLVMSWWRPRAIYDRVALAILGAASCAWLFSYPGHVWSSFEAPALAHPGLIVLFFLTAASFVAIRRIAVLERPGAAVIVKAALWTLGSMIFLATSLEVARIGELMTADPTVRRAAMSMWWGIVALALIAAGFWRRVAVARYTGLVVIGVAVLKALVFDLVGVSPGWRVLSVIALGLLLLIIAGGYARLAGRLTPRAS